MSFFIIYPFFNYDDKGTKRDGNTQMFGVES